MEEIVFNFLETPRLLLKEINPKNFKSEIGYVITDETFKRKGLITEALREIIKHGFEEMQLHRVYACISPDNIASIKTIEKLKFSYEGHMREDYFIENGYDDSKLYSLLKKLP